MILESVAVAGGIWSLVTKSSGPCLRWIINHPWLFEFLVWIVLLLIHGGSADGAMAATTATAALGVMHQVYRTYFLPAKLTS